MKYEMTYADFSRYLANHGFIENPLTEEQYDFLQATGFPESNVYGVACDVNALVDFNVARLINDPRDLVYVALFRWASDDEEFPEIVIASDTKALFEEVAEQASYGEATFTELFADPEFHIVIHTYEQKQRG